MILQRPLLTPALAEETAENLFSHTMLKLVMILQRPSLTPALCEEAALSFEKKLAAVLQAPDCIVEKRSWQVECSAV